MPPIAGKPCSPVWTAWPSGYWSLVVARNKCPLDRSTSVDLRYLANITAGHASLFSLQCAETITLTREN